MGPDWPHHSASCTNVMIPDWLGPVAPVCTHVIRSRHGGRMVSDVFSPATPDEAARMTDARPANADTVPVLTCCRECADEKKPLLTKARSGTWFTRK